MEAAQTTKTEEKKKKTNHVESVPDVQPAVRETLGAAKGMPLYLQQSACLSSVSNTVMRKEDKEKKPFDEIEDNEPLQAKLTIGQPGDAYEQEADQVAAKVMRMPANDIHHQTGDEKKIIQAKTDNSVINRSVSDSSNRVQTFHKEQKNIQRKNTKTNPSATSASTTNSNHRSMPGLIKSPGPGSPLAPSIRNRIEPALGFNLGQVQVHDDSLAGEMAQSISARAFTHKNHIWLGKGESTGNLSLMAHEATHVAQQHSMQTGNALQRCGNRSNVIMVDLIGPMDQYVLPGTSAVYRVGDAAGPNILTRIDSRPNNRVVFQWLNFTSGQYISGPVEQWQMLVLAGGFMGNTSEFSALGRQLSSAQWRSLGSDPLARLMAMHEEQQVNLSSSTVLTTYKGMIYGRASQSLDSNEAAIDLILNAPDEVRRLEEYATGLKEASIIRDHLETRRDELRRSLAQMQGFSFGLAGRIINLNTHRRLRIFQMLDPVDHSLRFWYRAFPLLTRLQTSEIKAGKVQATLQQIKANIVSTRSELEQARLGRGSIELMNLQPVRQQLQASIGARAQETISSEDRRRRRWAWISAGAILAGSIALLFVPGGVFIDAAIGIAIAAKAISEAAAIGRAANTGLHIEDGLMSQSQADWAVFGAVLATIGAGVGSVFAGFRIIRVARAFRGVSQAAPELVLASRMRLARLVAANPDLLASPRTTSALQDVLLEAGVDLSAAELRALRAASYHAQGLTTPATSSQGLDDFLERVWSQRERILGSRRGENAVYNMYSRATTPNTLTRSSSEYLDSISRISQGRPPGAVSNVQGAGAFFRFQRAGITNEALVRMIRERIYINVNADNATDVMRFVVREIVDNAERFPGIGMAKLAGVRGVARRADAIVIYTRDAAASERALAALRTFQASNPAYFRQGVPAMTEEVMRGVSVAAEPLGSAGAVSFGGVRAQAVHQALVQTGATGTRSQFVNRALQLLRQRGIDPDIPHLNLAAQAGSGTGGGAAPRIGEAVGPAATGASEAVNE